MNCLMLIPVQNNSFRFKLHSWSPWLPLPKVSEANIKLLISFLTFRLMQPLLTAKNFVFSAVSLPKPRKKSYGIFNFTPNCYSCSQKMLLKTQPSFPWPLEDKLRPAG